MKTPTPNGYRWIPPKGYQHRTDDDAMVAALEDLRRALGAPSDFTGRFPGARGWRRVAV